MTVVERPNALKSMKQLHTNKKNLNINFKGIKPFLTLSRLTGHICPKLFDNDYWDIFNVKYA